MPNYPVKNLWHFVRREPLVLFVLVGVVLFGTWRALVPRDVETIRVEQEVLRMLEKQHEELVGRPLTDEERAEAHEGYIEDEILLREALKRGLQWSDSRVRRRLTRIMRGALTETVPDPSVAQLQAYFQDNIDQYTSSESVTIEQVVYPWGEDVSREELVEILEKLRAGADPTDYGVSSILMSRIMQRQTRANLVVTFGADFADQVEELSAGQWHGPIESVQGVHLLRVNERHPPQVATFEDVEHYLRQAWLMEQTRALQQNRVDEIRERYRIEFVEE